jgi:hypothetical protein
MLKYNIIYSHVRFTSSTFGPDTVSSAQRREISCRWASPAQSFLVSALVGTLGHILLVPQTYLCFEIGPLLRQEGDMTGSLNICSLTIPIYVLLLA